MRSVEKIESRRRNVPARRVASLRRCGWRIQGDDLSARSPLDGADRGVIQVIDEGVGIPPEILPKVFEPFFTTKPPNQGTGIGLAVCKHIVEQFGGTIEIESEPGRGTTVTIVLPVQDREITSASPSRIGRCVS